MTSTQTTNKEGFADRLREVRNERGLSQRALAKISGIHYLSIGKYEREQIKPTAESLYKLAEALNVTTDYLIEGSTDELAIDRLSDRELLKRFQELEKLSEDDKDRAIDFLDGFLMKRKMQEMMAG